MASGKMFGKRAKLSPKKSKRQFKNGAIKTHRKNVDDRPMRGGIRL